MQLGRRTIQVVSFVLWLIPGFAAAKDWDPRLFEAPRLAYSGDYQQAEKLIDEYIAQYPEDPNGLMIKATVLDWKATVLGRPESENPNTLLLYKKANDMAFHRWNADQKNIDKMIDLGNSYILFGKKHADMGHAFKSAMTTKKAQKHLEEAIKLDPSRTDALFLLGAFHYMADSVSSALAPFKGLLGVRGTKAQGLAELKKSLTTNHPYVLDTKWTLIYIYTDMEKNYPEAIKIVSEFETLFPDNPEMVRKHAQADAMHDKAQGALSFVKQAQWCEAQGDKCNKFYIFSGYVDAAQIYQNLGQVDKAKELLAKSAGQDNKLDPSFTAKAQYLAGQIANAEGRHAEAIEQFSKAKAIPKIPKKLKKEIEGSLEKVCKATPVTGKC